MAHTSGDHQCYWETMKPSELERKLKDQEAFRWAFYDIETSQSREKEDGTFSYLVEHQAVLIVLGKVIKKCFI